MPARHASLRRHPQPARRSCDRNARSEETACHTRCRIAEATIPVCPSFARAADSGVGRRRPPSYENENQCEPADYEKDRHGVKHDIQARHPGLEENPLSIARNEVRLYLLGTFTTSQPVTDYRAHLLRKLGRRILNRFALTHWTSESRRDSRSSCFEKRINLSSKCRRKSKRDESQRSEDAGRFHLACAFDAVSAESKLTRRESITRRRIGPVTGPSSLCATFPFGSMMKVSGTPYKP